MKITKNTNTTIIKLNKTSKLLDIVLIQNEDNSRAQGQPLQMVGLSIHFEGLEETLKAFNEMYEELGDNFYNTSLKDLEEDLVTIVGEEDFSEGYEVINVKLGELHDFIERM